MAGPLDDAHDVEQPAAALHAVLPEPLREEPPADRFCDLVLAGGVASGVVYPWAILELAREFRFRGIGGTSVGAMAASLAAACEYGRCTGNAQAFEVLRQVPVELAQPVALPGIAPGSRMQSLFQPAAGGTAPMRILLAGLNAYYGNGLPHHGRDANGRPPKCRPWLGPVGRVLVGEFHLDAPLRLALLPGLMACAVALLAFVLSCGEPECSALRFGVSLILYAGVAAAAGGFIIAALRLGSGLVRALHEGIVDNDLGLCPGSSQVAQPNGQSAAALVEWLHEGIQRAAGRGVDAAPLTFEDLWFAPPTPGAAPPPAGRDGQPAVRSIDLQMITTNVTHGRPYRLPHQDADARLFFDPEAWQRYFPKPVMDALIEASEPYRPKSFSDPPAGAGACANRALRELPSGRLPLVVAARLSLSYPLLFSALPVFAIDYEQPDRQARSLRLCRFSDGGLCSNFPIHFFDAALPTRPTFGIWLQQRSVHRPKEAVWLPPRADKGRGDTWQRFEATSDAASPRADPVGGAWQRDDRLPVGPSTLFGFLWAALISAKDWRDRSAMRLPHVRRRVVRIGLRHGEDELNIAMPPATILEMAHVYGTAAGRLLCGTYLSEKASEQPAAAWREHLWVRLQTLLDGLDDLLQGFGAAADSDGHTLSIDRLLDQACDGTVIEGTPDTRALSPEDADELRRIVRQIRLLEHALARRSVLPQQQPAPKLRLQPPL